MKWERVNKQKVDRNESFLLYSEDTKEIGFGKFYDKGNHLSKEPHWEYYTNDGKILGEITHFMRLPNIPDTDDTKS
jgi:hypothetical protein